MDGDKDIGIAAVGYCGAFLEGHVYIAPPRKYHPGFEFVLEFTGHHPGYLECYVLFPEPVAAYCAGVLAPVAGVHDDEKALFLLMRLWSQRGDRLCPGLCGARCSGARPGLYAMVTARDVDDDTEGILKGKDLVVVYGLQVYYYAGR